jgi:hypothetical protein
MEYSTVLVPENTQEVPDNSPSYNGLFAATTELLFGIEIYRIPYRYVAHWNFYTLIPTDD